MVLPEPRKPVMMVMGLGVVRVIAGWGRGRCGSCVVVDVVDVDGGVVVNSDICTEVFRDKDWAWSGQPRGISQHRKYIFLGVYGTCLCTTLPNSFLF